MTDCTMRMTDVTSQTSRIKAIEIIIAAFWHCTFRQLGIAAVLFANPTHKPVLFFQLIFVKWLNVFNHKHNKRSYR